MTGIYVVEALDVNTGEIVRKVVIASSGDEAMRVAQFAGEAEIGRLGNYEPGISGARMVSGSVIATVVYG